MPGVPSGAGSIRAGFDDASTGGNRGQPEDRRVPRPARATPWASGALGSDSTAGALGVAAGPDGWGDTCGAGCAHVARYPQGPRGRVRCSPWATGTSPRIEASGRRESREVGDAEPVSQPRPVLPARCPSWSLPRPRSPRSGPSHRGRSPAELGNHSARSSLVGIPAPWPWRRSGGSSRRGRAPRPNRGRRPGASRGYSV